MIATEARSIFNPYDAAELRTVLENRADRAFVDKAGDVSAIAKAAALAAQDMRNARQALDLFRVGVELAEQNGEAPVTDGYIETARERVQRGRAANKIRDQAERAQYIRKRTRTCRPAVRLRCDRKITTTDTEHD